MKAIVISLGVASLLPNAKVSAMFPGLWMPLKVGSRFAAGVVDTGRLSQACIRRVNRRDRSAAEQQSMHVTRTVRVGAYYLPGVV